MSQKYLDEISNVRSNNIFNTHHKPRKIHPLTKHEASLKISKELMHLRAIAKSADQKHLVYFLEMAIHQAVNDNL